MCTARAQRTSTLRTHARDLVGEGPSTPSFLCFSIFIRCSMQIMAIVAMRALFSRLASHDAELPTHDARTIRDEDATAPNDLVDRDRPRLTYDTMELEKHDH
jgi:hypothetical protein